MILTDRDILFRSKKLGRPLVKPFYEKHLTPNGYDLSIEEIKIDNVINNINKGNIRVPRKTFFVGMTEEFVMMPKDMIAHLWIRSSYGRKGIILSASVVDAGYHGKIALSMYNASKRPVVFEKDKKRTVVQIVFETLDTIPSKTYTQRSGTYQNQNTLKIK